MGAAQPCDVPGEGDRADQALAVAAGRRVAEVDAGLVGGLQEGAAEPADGDPVRDRQPYETGVGRRAAEQASIILANLPAVSQDLESGAVVVLTEDWVRIRRLPMLG